MIDSEIEAVIARLQNEGLLSDQRYAESYIHMRKNKGYGPLRIEQELRERGVAECDYKSHLYAVDIDWSIVLQAAYDKKYGDRACPNYQDKTKRMRYLQYRGFALDKIRDLFK